MKKFLGFILILFALFSLAFYFFNPLRAPGGNDKTEILIIDANQDDTAALRLAEEGFIRSFSAFNIALGIKGKRNKIAPGGYYLSKNMDTWKIIDEITSGPDLKWVLVREGVRKEQIGEELGEVFGWSEAQVDKWNTIYTTMKPEYTEGVYFPDKYLIPVDESGPLIAKRMLDNFNTKLAPYYEKFEKENIKWTTAIKLASIIEREAAGPSDMPLIAGILWNRLLENQKLDIDATVQYAKGKTNGKWWPAVTSADIRNIDSPYNTYKYAGLPPHPISNPGLSAIDAVLNPEQTGCFYYLHDASRQIHCAKTYEKHLENINKYLD